MLFVKTTEDAENTDCGVFVSSVLSVVFFTPHPDVRCFTHVFRTFISGKFEVSDGFRNHRTTVSFA